MVGYVVCFAVVLVVNVVASRNADQSGGDQFKANEITVVSPMNR